MFESIGTSIEKRYGWVSKKGLTRTGVWINTEENQSKYRRVLRKRLHGWVFELIRTCIERR